MVGVGPCDLCGRDGVKREVDHDHATDRIRGYVCRRCNFLLGVGNDDPELLSKAIAYLENPPRDGSYTDAVRQYRNEFYRSPRQRQHRAAYMRGYKKRKREAAKVSG